MQVALISVLALVAGVVAGCGSDAVTAPSRSPSLTLPSGLQLEVEVDRSVLHAGESALVTVRLSNPTQQALSLEFPSACQLLFDVLDTSGAVVAPEPVGCATVITRLELPAGGASEKPFHWDGRSADGTPLPSGSYGVVGSLATADRPRTEPVLIRLER